MHRRLRRRMVLGVAATAVVAVPLAIAWPSLAAQLPGRSPHTTTVANLPALARALSQAAPGDRISVADGVFSSGTVTLSRSGTATQPITVSAANTGRTRFTGTAGLRIARASHIVVQGFMFVLYDNKQYPPSDITLADNILVGKGPLIRPAGTGLKYQGNIISGGPAGVPGPGFRSADPNLTAGADSVLRLGGGSPAVGAAVGVFPQVTRDMDGQSRAAAKDVGADQLNGAGPQHRPLTATDVGPAAP